MILHGSIRPISVTIRKMQFTPEGEAGLLIKNYQQKNKLYHICINCLRIMRIHLKKMTVNIKIKEMHNMRCDKCDNIYARSPIIGIKKCNFLIKVKIIDYSKLSKIFKRKKLLAELEK